MSSQDTENDMAHSSMTPHFLIEPRTRLARWVFDFATYDMLEVNQSALNLFKCSRAEFLELNPYLLTIKTFAIDKNSVQNQLMEEGALQLDLPIGNRVHDFQTSLWQLTEFAGKTAVTVVVLDAAASVISVLHKATESSFMTGGATTQNSIDLVSVPSTDESTRQDLEVRLRLSMSSAGAGTWDWNLKTQRINWSEEFFALLDRPYLSLTPSFESWIVLFHPEDQDEFRQQVEKVIQRRLRQLDVEYRLKLPNGTWRWLSIKGRLFLDEQGHAQRLIGIILDISERRRIEQVLRLNEQRYRSLAQATSAVVWHANATGDFQQGAAVWLNYTGQAEYQSLGNGWIQAFHKDDQPLIAREWRAALAGHKQFSAQGKLWHAESQSYRAVAVHGVPVFDANEPSPREWIGTCIDITEQLQAEKQRRLSLKREHTLRKVAETANRALEQANRTKDEFLATLSHELRTPLTAIQGWAQVLRRTASSEDTFKRAITAIEESAQAQTRLVEDLLNISDIVVGKLRLNIQPMVLKQAIEAALQTVRPAIDNKRIKLYIECAEADTDTIFGDPARIQQIVWNLISNAVKFTPSGGSIYVRCERDSQHVCLDIQDTGEGISPEFLPFVFDRFRQADSSSKRRHGGLGLGLAIVRYLTELHGGTVSADSAGIQCGARFRIMLPVAALPIGKETHANLSTPEIKSDLPSLPLLSIKGVSVVSVDDDRNTREMLEEALKSFGAVVHSAASAQLALQLIRDVKPDVLISDIGMADEDGYDLIRQLRQFSVQQGGTTPAIALTGYARPQDQGLAKAAGFDAYLSKPVDLDLLIEVISRLVFERVLE